MISEFVKAWDERKGEIEAKFSAKAPDRYEDIVRAVVEILRAEYGGCEGDSPDPERIITIDHGDHSGTLLFVIGADGYQPCDYWYVFVSYGSCCVCDTLESIQNASDGPTPTVEQVRDYMTLALHILQGIKRLGCDLPASDEDARDALRYRWLRDEAVNAEGDTPMCMLAESSEFLDGEYLDSSIDEAMAVEGGEA